MILSKQNGSFIFYLHAHQLLFERCIKKNCLTQINLIGDEKKSSGSAAPEAHQFLESFLEVLVGHGVDDRVNEGVQVSQPGEEVEQLLVETRDTRGHQQGVDEKREPANDVSAEDDPQSLGGFPFPGRGDALFFQERVGDGHFHLVVARGRAGVAGRGVVPPALQGGGGRHRPGGVGDQVRGGPYLKFEDEVEALQDQVNQLEKLGVNKIIALGHSGFEVDKDIAKRVRGIDVVIGGHTNTFLYTGKPPSTEVPRGPYPFNVSSNDGRWVPVVQAFAFGKYLGYLKVTFDQAGKVVKAVGNPILMNSSIPQDPGILSDVEKWKKGLEQYSSQYIGQTLVYLNGTFEECRFRECNLGNLICDAMIYNYIRYSNKLQWNHVGVCMLNSGSIRATIDERSTNGSITMEEILSVLPFGGTFDLVQLKGSTLKKAFEHSVHRYGGMSGEFLQVSGIRVEYDLSKPVNQRVVSLLMRCTECRVPKFEPLDPQKTYTVVMTSFMVGGGDGYSMIQDELLKHNTGNLDTLVFSEYIKDMRRVYPAVEGRITFRNSAAFAAHSLSLMLLSLCLFLNLCM